MAEEEFQEGAYTGGYGQAQQASHGQAGRKQGGGGANAVHLPTLEEAAALHELEHNWEETDAKTKELQADQDKLHETYAQCEETVKDEFQKLRNLLTQREELLLAQLTGRYNDRDTKLSNQIDALETHKADNERTEDECKGHISTMTERSQRKDRKKQVQKLIEACIQDSPSIDKVPVDLKWVFSKHDDTVKQLTQYGRLDYRRIDSGKAMKFTKLNTRFTKNSTIITGPIRESDIPLPLFKAGNCKLKKGDPHPTFEFKIEDARNLDEKDNEGLKAAYESRKSDSFYIQVQCVANNEKGKFDDWDNVNTFDFQTCKLLSDATQQNGKFSVTVNGAFEIGSQIHGRARLLFITNDDAINDKDGNVDDQDIFKNGDWCKTSKISFGKVGNKGEMNDNKYDEDIAAVAGNGNGNGDEDGKDEKIAEGGSGGGDDDGPGGGGAIALPDKVKINLTCPGQARAKLVTLRQGKGTYWDQLVNGAQSKFKMPGVEFTFMMGNDQDITDDASIEKHCVPIVQADPKAKVDITAIPPS